MKTLLAFGYLALAIFAISTLGLEVEIFERLKGNYREGIVYACALIGSLIYLQWFTKTLLVPLSVLPKDVATKIKKSAQQKYSKSFLAGTIGFGYLIIICHIYEVISPKIIVQDKSMIYSGLFFIILGSICHYHHQIKIAFLELHSTKQHETKKIAHSVKHNYRRVM
jgi:hypothetical protein